jgi:hypothetical protein
LEGAFTIGRARHCLFFKARSATGDASVLHKPRERAFLPPPPPAPQPPPPVRRGANAKEEGSTPGGHRAPCPRSARGKRVVEQARKFSSSWLRQGCVYGTASRRGNHYLPPGKCPRWCKRRTEATTAQEYTNEDTEEQIRGSPECGIFLYEYFGTRHSYSVGLRWLFLHSLDKKAGQEYCGSTILYFILANRSTKASPTASLMQHSQFASML